MHANDHAFPAEDDGLNHYSGMTIRTYIATKLMAGLISNPNTMPETTNQALAKASCSLADALIAELSKP